MRISAVHSLAAIYTRKLTQCSHIKIFVVDVVYILSIAAAGKPAIRV